MKNLYDKYLKEIRFLADGSKWVAALAVAGSFFLAICLASLIGLFIALIITLVLAGPLGWVAVLAMIATILFARKVLADVMSNE